MAPCMGYISKEEYKRQIDQIIMLLEGKIDNIIKATKIDMEEASKNLEFEKAAELRDKIKELENGEKQSNRKKTHQGEHRVPF